MNLKGKLVILFVISIIVGNGLLDKNKSIAASLIDKADLYSKGTFSGLLKLGDVGIECSFIVYEKDGVEYPAYCLNKDLPGVGESGSYSVGVDSLVSNVMIWRAITNGYPYKSAQELGCDNNNQAYLATKQAVYCILYDRDPNSYTAIGPDGEKCLNALKNIVLSAKNSSSSKIFSNISIIADKTKWEIDRINNKYISMTFVATSEGGMNKYTIEIEGEIPEGTLITNENNETKNQFNRGEKFKILMPITNILKDGNFNISVKGEVNTKPILLGKAPTNILQDYALTGTGYEEGEGVQKIYFTQNLTKIVILKQELNTKVPLQGVEFEILDANQEKLYSGLVTNEKGEIIVENIHPGTYYIKETKTLEGYTLYDKLIEITLDLNERLTIIVNNSGEEVTIEMEKKETVLEVENTASTIVKLPRTGM